MPTVIQRELLKVIANVRGVSAAEALKAELDVLSPEDSQRACRVLYEDLKDSLRRGRISMPRAKRIAARKREIVSPEEFLMSDQYLGLRTEVYPKVVKHYVEINSGEYDEAILTGAIGVAKTTIALWTCAYQLYLLSRMKNPQREFGQESTSEILIVFQSITGRLARSVDYDRFRAMITRSAYFNRHFMFDSQYLTEMRFPNRIIVRPVSGQETAAIGQNVIGGVIDEVNYMAKVEKSKQSVDGGTYDQAIALYNSISRRRKSRFMRGGRLPGVLCLVSSKRYPGQFTDLKEEEARAEIESLGYTRIYIYDKRTWEVLPSERFSGNWMRVFVGDMSRQPRILKVGESVSDADVPLVMDVPEEYRGDFERDIYNALREIGGKSTIAGHPFFTRVDKVAATFGSCESVLDGEHTDFGAYPIKLYPGRILDPQIPRYAHVDSSVTGDSTGVAVGAVVGFVKVPRGDGAYETLPKIRFDLILRVDPPKGGEIEFERVRRLLYLLRDSGMNLQWVSYDSYQSRDSVQILRSKGFKTGLVSVDKSPDPYDSLKTAIYDGRVVAPEHGTARKEILSLEADSRTGKLDHPPNGSKDCADAMAAVVYGITMQREVWNLYNVPLVDRPESLAKTGAGFYESA